MNRLLPLVLIVVIVATATAVIGLELERERPGSTTQRERSGTLNNAVPSAAPSPASQGHLGLTFPADLTRPPTADKGQSKLWFHDGSWWGVLMSPSATGSHIYRLEPDSRTWVDTEVPVDDRIESRADALSDGDRLYIVTSGASPIAGEHARLMRYSYDPVSRRYTLDPRYPVQLTETGVKRLTVAKDTTGTLWIAYVVDDRLWISHSVNSDRAWTVPYLLSAPGTAVAADQAVMLADGQSVVVAWSNQVEAAVWLARHVDGDAPDAWAVTSTPLEGGLPADDHMEIGSLPGPDGTSIFIVVKTALDTLDESQGRDPQMILLALRPDGRWTSHVYGELRDRHTQPLLLVDEDARELLVFAVAPFGEGSVYYKRTSADDISLAPGVGTAFLEWPDGPLITTPTSTKQNVKGTSDIVILAADVTTDRYVHGVLDLSEGTQP